MASASVTAGFLSRVLHDNGTVQVYLKRGPDKAPGLIVEQGDDFISRAATQAYGKVDAHFTLCAYQTFDPSSESRYKRAPEYHTGYGRRCVVIDVDDKDNKEDLSTLSHTDVAARIKIRPDIIVRSGRGGFHCYWCSERPLLPTEFYRADTYLREIVSEEFVIDDRAGSTLYDTMRLPGSLNPKTNAWCYVEADYASTTLVESFFEALPAMIIPGWGCPLGNPFVYPLHVQAGIPISTEVPPPRFSNEELRQCAAYASIQDEAHTHAGHMIDLFYLSWARCIRKPVGVSEENHLAQVLEDIVIKPLAQCNTPMHYAQQWVSLKDRPGLRCQNLQGTSAERCCEGCPQYRADSGSPNRLLIDAQPQRAMSPQTPPPQQAVPPQGPTPPSNIPAPLPPPVPDQPMLPRGYAWSSHEPEKIVKVDKEGKVTAHLTEHITLVGRASIVFAGIAVQAMVLKLGHGLHVYPFRMNDNETLRRIGGISSGASVLGKPSMVYQLLAQWMKIVPQIDHVQEKMGWLSNGGFCGTHHLITPDGYVKAPLLYENHNPSYGHVFDPQDLAYKARNYWDRIAPYVGVPDNSVGRLVLLTQLASTLDTFLENVTRGNVWFSLRGETGTGKSSVLALAKGVFGTQDDGASFTLSGLENALCRQCEVPVVIDEFSMRGESAKFEAQALLAVMAGHTGVRATRDGTQNAPTLSWKGFTIFASNEGLLSRLAGEAAPLQAARARVVEHNQKPSRDPHMKAYTKAIASDTEHNGELGALFAHWVVNNKNAVQGIVDSLVRIFDASDAELGGGPERFSRKWGLLCMAAAQILDRQGLAIDGFDSARLWDTDIHPTIKTQESRRQRAKQNDPLLSLDAFLRSRKISKIQVAGFMFDNANRQYFREPVFVGYGYFYIPIEAVKAVAGQHQHLTDADYDSLCDKWSGTRKVVLLPDEGQDLRFDCIVVSDESYAGTPKMIEKTHREFDSAQPGKD